MNLVERLLSHPDDRPALIAPGGSWTYGELAARVGRWRGGLAAAGVGPGDRVVVIAGNSELFVLAHLSILGLGAAMAPLNPASPVAELAREIAAVDPAAVLVDPATGLDLDPGSIARLLDPVDLLDRPARTERQPDITDPVDVLDGPIAPGRSPTMLDPGTLDGGEPVPVAQVDDDAPAALLFTSGTAGMPKPAVLTHGNLDASLRSVESLPIDLRSTPQVILAVIPLFHVFGYNAMINLGLDIGGTIVVEDYRGPARVAELVAANDVTILGGPPTLWLALSADADLGPEQFETVSLALSGAAKLPADTRLAVRSRIGLDVDEGYGLTETAAMVATSVATDAPVGSVGRLLPGVEARLVDSTDADVLVGDPGELLVRGPMVSPGYFIPDAPTGPVDGGEEWLRTGDVAVVDDDGNLAIVDRLKDLVIVSGFNVYPGEVEEVIRAHPDVAGAGVIGEPDPVTGEALVAYVVARDGADLDPDDLLEHCRGQLARYKVPSRIELRDELPVGSVGKLRRRDLA